MSKRIIYLLLLVLTVYSCKQKHELLTGTWHGVKLENADIDSFFVRSQHYIDTIGKSGDATMNMSIYGVTNMDSLRGVLQAQYDTAKAMQMMAVTNTVFRFTADSMAILSFNGVKDTGRWYIDTANKLVLEDITPNGGGEKGNMEIITLTDDVLKLRFREDSNFSTVTFMRQGK